MQSAEVVDEDDNAATQQDSTVEAVNNQERKIGTIKKKV